MCIYLPTRPTQARARQGKGVPSIYWQQQQQQQQSQQSQGSCHSSCNSSCSSNNSSSCSSRRSSSSILGPYFSSYIRVCASNLQRELLSVLRTQNHGQRKTSVQPMTFGIKWHEGVKNGWCPSGHRTTVKPCSNLFQAETLDLVLLWGAASPHLMEAVLDLGMQMHEGRSTRSAQDTEVSVSNGKSTDFRASKVLQPKNWMAHSWFTSKMTHEISRSTAKSPSRSQPVPIFFKVRAAAKSLKFPQHVNLIFPKQSLKCCLILKTS